MPAYRKGIRRCPVKKPLQESAALLCKGNGQQQQREKMSNLGTENVARYCIVIITIKGMRVSEFDLQEDL
jgi:hypothetical protein